MLIKVNPPPTSNLLQLMNLFPDSMTLLNVLRTFYGRSGKVHIAMSIRLVIFYQERLSP